MTERKNWKKISEATREMFEAEEKALNELQKDFLVVAKRQAQFQSELANTKEALKKSEAEKQAAMMHVSKLKARISEMEEALQKVSQAVNVLAGGTNKYD